SLDRGGGIVSHHVIAANHVENDVGAPFLRDFPDDRDKVLGAVVDRALSPKLQAGLAFFRTAGSGDNTGSEGGGELDRGGADTRRAAMHQQSFAAFEAAAFEYIVPDGEEGFGKSGSLGEGEAGRNRQRMAFMNPDIFRIAPTGR